MKLKWNPLDDPIGFHIPKNSNAVLILGNQSQAHTLHYYFMVVSTFDHPEQNATPLQNSNIPPTPNFSPEEFHIVHPTNQYTPNGG